MNEQGIKYQQAKGRVSALRRFYVHLAVYIGVNLILFLINIIVSPNTLWFFWPLLGWGIAIALHALPSSVKAGYSGQIGKRKRSRRSWRRRISRISSDLLAE